jgi:pyridoxamine 5'-phosphate oxidase
MSSPSTDPAQLRVDYRRAVLDEHGVARDPFAQFARWFDEAVAAELPEPNAMTLATIADDGRPAARIVLLKGVDARGLVFYTNCASRKGRELARDPRAAIVFFWHELERQVRVEGVSERVADAESDEYFASRPRGSRLSAWASPQSEKVESRAWLERRLAEFELRFQDAGDAVPRPRHWGGYRLIPESFEFWQGRASRLHDRIEYTRAGDAWSIARLAP